ncbi:hypothetical protein N7537_009674 [Penicillium hordei]|uniref:Uncharacterized protein n=1 Tax=Penicillium hordei TaxID=40994 RepID=A0AAD6GXD6_9EURO|nr:uncharacterized protein N7537_009674 [Penicillium hordei]KAJ5592770.1 hypothetical protein N7537_009674 [Penicillium hordei]
MTKTAIPPKTPPMIAPRFEDGAVGVLDVSKPADVSKVIEEVVEEGGDAVVDGSVDKTVVNPEEVDVEEVVVVLGVTLGSKPMAPAVINESVSLSLSFGQMPIVHGSLEQHPRKLPAVQTYHCLVPVQELESRGMIDSRDLRVSISNTILKDQVSFTESEDNLIKSQDTAVMLDNASFNDWR